jgi:hypothetical protein
MIQHFLEIGRQFGRARKIEAIAMQVAETSMEKIHLRIVGCTAAMTTSETRGFIRARAGHEIRRQTRILLSRQQSAGSDWETRVIHLATEKVIPLVLRPRPDKHIIQPPLYVAA